MSTPDNLCKPDHNDETMSVTVDKFLLKVREEIIRAYTKYGNFTSAHEGMSVTREEVDEMWDEVKADNIPAAANEAVQVAAMASLFAINFADSTDREFAKDDKWEPDAKTK